MCLDVACKKRVRFAQWVSRCMRESVYACEGA